MAATSPRKSPAKKAPAKKAPAKRPEPGEPDDGTAAEAAAAEVQQEDEPITVPFRGAEFTVDPVVRRSGRYALSLASAQYHIAIVELIGNQQVPRFIALCEHGEELSVVAGEFFDALGEASRQGNS